MLHRINPPSCAPALQWLVDLQRDLLAALCLATTTSAVVTKEWVANLRLSPPTVNKWLKEFAGRSFEKKTLINAMHTVADLDDSKKTAILDYFKNNLQFPRWFDPSETPLSTVDVSSIGDTNAENALKVILTAFYKVALCSKGLPVDANGNPGGKFEHKQVVEMFVAENDLTVCPLCDGDFNGPEVDHWLPESKFPALSCHPKNLVPICHLCNSPSHKHHKPPISLGQSRPFDEWFHPYERPAVGEITIEVTDGKRIHLKNTDHLQQKRIDNFDRLIKLSERWSTIYQQHTQDYLRMLAHKGRIGRIQPTEHDLLQAIQDWLDDIASARHERHSILKRHILEMVNDRTTPYFSAWLKHLEDAVVQRRVLAASG